MRQAGADMKIVKSTTGMHVELSKFNSLETQSPFVSFLCQTTKTVSNPKGDYEVRVESVQLGKYLLFTIFFIGTKFFWVKHIFWL